MRKLGKLKFINGKWVLVKEDEPLRRIGKIENNKFIPEGIEKTSKEAEHPIMETIKQAPTTMADIVTLGGYSRAKRGIRDVGEAIKQRSMEPIKQFGKREIVEPFKREEFGYSPRATELKQIRKERKFTPEEEEEYISSLARRSIETTIGMMGGGKAIPKALSKVKDIKKIKTMLKGTDVTEDVAKSISKTKSVKEIEKLLKPSPISKEARKAQNDLYKEVSIKWGSDDYLKYLKDEKFINDLKSVFKTHSEPVTNFKKTTSKPPTVNYRGLLEYKKVLSNYNKPYIKTEKGAIDWVKKNRPEEMSEVLDEIKKAKSLRGLQGDYISFAIGYDGKNALKEGVSKRPLSISYAGKSSYEGQKVVKQFGKNTGSVFIHKNSYVLPIKGAEYSAYEKELVIPTGSKIRNIQTGYTGFGTRQFDTFVDTPNITKTKSQLTDIFNKTKPQKITKPISKVEDIVPTKATAQYPSKIGRQPKDLPKTLSEKVGQKGKEMQKPALSKQRLDRLASPSLENVTDYSKTKKLLKNKWTTKLREWGQDRMIRVKKLVESPDIKVSDKTDPYLAETLFHGRVASRMEDIKKKVKVIDADIVKTAKTLKVKSGALLENVNKYLVAKHAPERNLQLGENAAGITTKQANRIVEEISGSAIGKDVKRISDSVKGMNRQVLDTLYKGEVIDKKLYNLLHKTYKDHVPLNRILDDSGDVAEWLTGGKGFGVKGTGIKRAKGSQLKVADIMENVTANVEQAIVRAEKNRVGLTVLRFARDNKMVGGLFQEVKPKAIGRTFKGEMITKDVTDPLVLTVREKGKPVHLKINDESLAGALQGVNIEHLPNSFKWINSITRFYSSLATRYNPEFAFSNIIRDMQENMVYMSAQKKIGFKGAAKVPTKLASSAKDIINSMRGKKTSGAKLYEQMVKDGGTTGGMALSTKKQVQIDLENIRRINRSNPEKATEKFLQGIDNWNQVFEDANRLSSYKVALENGFSRSRAAQISKEATVNFNRKGTAGPIINSLYMFSNASIQGSAKMLMAMKNPKVATAVVTSVVLPVVATNQWNDSIDPDWRDKVTDWDRISNLPILIPGEEGVKYATIPVSWGLKPIMAMANVGYDMSVNKSKGFKNDTERLVTAITESYNPIGGSDIFSALMPTVGDIPSDIVRNKAWYGSPIMPEYNEELPKSERFFKSIEKTASGRLSKKLTDKTSELTNREIELSPENIDYAFNQIISGAGKFVNKTINLVSSIGKEEKPRPQETPVVSRFLKERSEEEISQTTKYKKQDVLFEELRKLETNSVEQKDLIKDYLGDLPDDKARQSALFQIRDGGFKTTGIRSSGAMLKAEDIYNELKGLPPQKAEEQAKKMVGDDEAVGKALTEVIKEEKRGLTEDEKTIRRLDIDERTVEVKNVLSELQGLKKKEKAQDYYNKGILTEGVIKQFIKEEKSGGPVTDFLTSQKYSELPSGLKGIQKKAIYEKLKKTPKDEVTKIMEQMKEKEYYLWKGINDLVKEDKLGMTEQEKKIKNLDYKNRAKEMSDTMKAMGSKERNSYLSRMEEIGAIPKTKRYKTQIMGYISDYLKQ